MYHGMKFGGVVLRVVASSSITEGAVARSSSEDVTTHRSLRPILVRLVTLTLNVVLAAVTLMVPELSVPLPHVPLRTDSVDGT